MVSFLANHRASPIGVDIGSHSVKLLQLSADHSRIVCASRWDFDHGDSPEGDASAATTDALRQAMEGRRFRGRDAVLCLGARDLFVQNIRIPKARPDELPQIVQQEAAGRLPYAINDAELRFTEAADVRQGEQTKREVIVMAVHRPTLEAAVESVIEAGLRPVAVDVEPYALLRCYAKQFRRDEDREQRAMFVNVGSSNTAVVIAHGDEPLFIKYLDIGGRHMDQAVADQLHLSLSDATALRRHNGDRRADAQDPEVMRSIAECLRPVLDELASELSMCVRYHSVTFRGKPLMRLVLGGGEANESLATELAARLDLKSHVGEPLRSFEDAAQTGRKTQWDVAAGLAMRSI
ncbi:MAG: pilus assembly protein PilM [Pirellulales bacterium]|nr:pilus assembly protein PilM [Pirellulales bacterium]